MTSTLAKRQDRTLRHRAPECIHGASYVHSLVSKTLSFAPDTTWQSMERSNTCIHTVCRKRPFSPIKQCVRTVSGPHTAFHAFMLYSIVFHKDFRILFRAHSDSPLSPAHIWGLLHLPSSRLHPSHPPFLPPIPTTPTISNHKLTTTLSPWTPYRVKFSSSP